MPSIKISEQQDNITIASVVMENDFNKLVSDINDFKAIYRANLDQQVKLNERITDEFAKFTEMYDENLDKQVQLYNQLIDRSRKLENKCRFLTISLLVLAVIVGIIIIV